MTTPRTDELPTPQWAADVRPGDTLVLSFDRRLTMEQAAWTRHRFADVLPGVKLAIVDGVSSMAVQRAEADATKETTR